MSSIDASDRSRKTDEVRKQREDYNNRETEAAKRHKKEIKRLTEYYDKEIQDLKSTYENQMDELRRRSSDSMSERDRENQADIAKLRGLYQETLKKKTEEQDWRRNELEQTMNSTIEKERKISQQQKDLLQNQFRTEIRENEKNYSQLANDSRESMQKALEERTRKLNDKHGRELHSLTEDRDRVISENERVQRQARSAYRNTLKDSERQHRTELTRTTDNWKSHLEKKENSFNALIQGRDEGYKSESVQMREKYKAAVEAKLQQMDDAQQTLKEQTNQRVDKEVRSAQLAKHKAENDRVLENISNNRIRDLERDHIIEAYEKRMGDLENQKKQIADLAHETSQERIENTLRKAERLIQDTNRNHQLAQSLKNEKAAEYFASSENNHRAEVNRIKNKADERINKTLKIISKTEQDQNNLHRKDLDQVKAGYFENLAKQREAQQAALRETYARMEQRLRDTENKLSKKLQETVDNYEAKIDQIQEQFGGEFKRQELAYEQRMKSQQKAHHAEQETQSMKFDSKMAMMEDAHQKEVDRLEKRHQQQMADLGNRMSYLKNKA